MTKTKRLIVDKIEMLAILFFIFAIFLLDVNVNMLATYGPSITVPVINNIRVAATSMFWLGFIVACFSFFILAIRSKYRHIRIHKNIDSIFIVVGLIGLAIIFAGGLLLFGPNDNLSIPFFKWILTRVTFYHIGLGLEFISIIYFALTK